MVIVKNTTELSRGHLQVFLDGQTLGHTEGGATVSIERDVAETNVDDFGTSPVDTFVQGEGATVTLRSAQVVNLEVMSKLIPGSTLTASGLEQSSSVGTSLLGSAFQLVLSGTNGVTSQQWTFHKANVVDSFDLEYNRDNQTIAEVPFRVFPDPAREGQSDQLWRYQVFPT